MNDFYLDVACACDFISDEVDELDAKILEGTKRVLAQIDNCSFVSYYFTEKAKIREQQEKLVKLNQIRIKFVSDLQHLYRISQTECDPNSVKNLVDSDIKLVVKYTNYRKQQYNK